MLFIQRQCCSVLLSNMPPKERAVAQKRCQQPGQNNAVDIPAVALTNLQLGNLYESRHVVPRSVCITDELTVNIGSEHLQTLDILTFISVQAATSTSCIVRSADKTCTIAYKSTDYKGFRISPDVFVLIFKTVLVCLRRSDLSIQCEILIDENISSVSHSICLSEVHDKIVLTTESTSNLIAYGGGQSPAALHCSIVSTTTGDVVAEYEIPFARVSYFNTTLRTYCHKDTLMISCWDDMQLKVVNLHTGAELFILEKNEEAEGRGCDDTGGLHASIKCVACSDEYIVVGYEWQRYIKACPLRVYSATTGQRLHLLAANGATPKCFSIRADQNLLFSCAENAREVKVWDLVSGTRRYTIPSVEKVVDIKLDANDSLYVRSNEFGYMVNPVFSSAPVSMSNADLLSIWKGDKSSDQLQELFEDNLPENETVMSAGKVLNNKKRRV